MDHATSHIRTVSAIAALDLANELLERKLVTEDRLFTHYPLIWDLAMRCQQKEPQFIIEEKRLPESELIKLWQETEIHHEKSEVGLLIGCKINSQAKGVLANWISHCDTLGQAFTTFKNHISLLNPSEHWTQEILDNKLRLTFQFFDLRYPIPAIERSMSALITWAEFFCGKKIQILSAGFCHPKPAYSSQYFEVFGPTISFESPSNFIELNADILNLPIPSSNDFIHALLREKATEILSHCQGNTSYCLYQLISTDIAQYSRIENACEALHMSRSKLYRQLKNEGTSYTHILDTIRHQAARKFKISDMSDDNIALNIGFKDVTSYYKARRRWRQKKDA